MGESRATLEMCRDSALATVFFSSLSFLYFKANVSFPSGVVARYNRRTIVVISDSKGRVTYNTLHQIAFRIGCELRTARIIL